MKHSRDLERVFSAMAHGMRLEILNLLSILHDGCVSCQELLRIHRVPKANMSQNLAVLEGAGLITRRRCGIHVNVTITPRGLVAFRAARDVMIWMGIEYDRS